jgi:hypothetical protein
MKRRSDWEKRLDDYIRSVQRIPHCYGEHDCALYVAGAIEVMTGEDLMADLRGQYRDEETAYTLLTEAHGGTLEGACRDRLGEPVAPLLARRGDVVLGPWGEDGGEVLGLVVSSRISTVTAAGLRLQRLGEARLAWRVG